MPSLMGTRKDMISPLPVPKIPPDFSIANVSVTMAVGAPVAVCVCMERGHAQMAAFWCLLRGTLVK